MSCPFCGCDTSVQADFCPTCGAELPRQSEGGAASADALAIGTLLAGTYAVESVLGQGGFGITYCCHDRMLDRKVAIKEFFPAGCRRTDDVVQPSRGLSDAHFSEARAQFLAEARLLARCHHAGIVGVHTAFEANSTAYMVMELLHGSTLAQLMETRGACLSEAEAVPFIERVGEALQFVHDQGLLHRDIKPENIIVCDDGRVMLIDFGTAREYAQGQAQGHTIVVTPGYAPLEQYARQARRGAFTDVYGLAATLYHLLTGNQPPAASDRAVGVQLRPVSESYPQISANVAQAIEAGLQMEIAKRPQSVREFLGLMHAPAANGAATFRTALTPQQSALAESKINPKAEAESVKLRDEFLGLSSPPEDFSALPWQVRTQFSNEQLDPISTPSVQPVQLAPPLSPSPVALSTQHSSAPPANSLDGGGFITKPTSSSNRDLKAGFWFFGVMAVLLASAIAFSPRAANKPSNFPPNFSPSTSSFNPRNPSSSATNFESMMREKSAQERTERQEIESASAILPVSVESLPISKAAETTLSKNAATTTVRNLAEFSPDGQMVAYTDKAGVLRVWSLAKRRVVSSLPQSKSNFPEKVLFSPDAKSLVLTYRKTDAQNSRNQISVWNLETDKLLGTLSAEPKKEWLMAGAPLRDGRILVAKTTRDTYKESLLLWNPRTGQQNPLQVGEITGLQSLDVSADGKRLATGHQNGQVQWRNFHNGAKKAESSTGKTYEDLRLSPSFSSNMFGSASGSGPLPVESLHFSRNGAYLAGMNRMQIRVFDAEARLIGTLPVGFSPKFAVSSDGKFIVEGGSAGSLQRNLLWNVRTQQKTRLYGPWNFFNAWSFSPDGKQVVGLLASQNRVSLVKWQIGAKPVVPFSAPKVTPLARLKYPYQLAQGAFLPNGVRALQNRSRLEIRDSSDSLISPIEVGEEPVRQIAFSPDGRLLSVVNVKGEAQILNVQGGQKVAQLTTLEPAQIRLSPTFPRFERETTKSLIFSADSRFLAHIGSAQGKSVIELWNLQNSPRRVASLALSQPLTGFAFSPDSRALICSEVGGQLSCYDVATRKLIAKGENAPEQPSGFAWTKSGLVIVGDVGGGRGGSFVTRHEIPSTGAATKPNASPQKIVEKQRISEIGFFAKGNSLAISPDGRFLASAPAINISSQPTRGITIWNLATGSQLQTLPIMITDDGRVGGAGLSVGALTFSPDGSQISWIESHSGGKLQSVSWKCPPLKKQSR